MMTLAWRRRRARGAALAPLHRKKDELKLSAVHQRWTNNIKYAGDRLAVVGSGATALALVSSLAEGGAAHVTHGATQPDVLRRATA